MGCLQTLTTSGKTAFESTARDEEGKTFKQKKKKSSNNKKKKAPNAPYYSAGSTLKCPTAMVLNVTRQ